MEYGVQQHHEEEINLDVVVCTEVRRRKKDGLKAAGSEEGKVNVFTVTDSSVLLQQKNKTPGSDQLQFF